MVIQELWVISDEVHFYCGEAMKFAGKRGAINKSTVFIMRISLRRIFLLKLMIMWSMVSLLLNELWSGRLLKLTKQAV